MVLKSAHPSTSRSILGHGTRSLLAVGTAILVGSFIATPPRVLPMGTAPPDRDERDTLVLEDGTELRGRVLRPYGETAVEIKVKGRTKSIDRDKIVSRSTVNDRLAAWLNQRRPSLSIDRQWQLVQQAEGAGLPAMARLQAYHVLVLEPNHQAAHDFLDHRGKPEAWRWRFDGKLVTTDRFHKLAASDAGPLALSSEHWRVTCNAGLATTIASLFELETLYVEFFSEFGPHLDPTEQIEPMDLRIYAQRDDMPAHSSFLSHPHYDPGELLSSTLGTSSQSITHLELGQARPKRLFDLGTQQILYEAVLGFALSQTPVDTSRFRANASLEIGLAHWMSTTFGGPFGYAERVGAVLAPEIRQAAEVALNGGIDSSDPVERLALYDYARYQIYERGNPYVWAHTQAFFSWLMEPATILPTTNQPGYEFVLCLLQAIHRDALGSSTTRWDNCLGAPLGSLIEPYASWL